MELLHFILWSSFAVSCGIAEGHLYHLKDVDKAVGKDSFLLKLLHKMSFGLYKNPNEHATLNIVRFVASLFLLINYDFIEALIMGACFVFAFPLLHDGFYYMTRHDLNPEIYRGGFRAENKNDGGTSWSLKFNTRAIWFVVSGVLLTIALFL